MELKEFYEKVGGDFDGVFSRLAKEERIVKYLKMFYSGDDFSPVYKAYEEKDYPELFRSTHNLKGLALNLGLSKLADSSSELCELVRNKEPECDLKPFVETVKEDYFQAKECLKDSLGL